MRKGERLFSETRYAVLSEENAAKRMLARGYCQVSRRFGHVARVDVFDRILLERVGVSQDFSVPNDVIRSSAEGWYDYYRRCVSEDVITDVPESIMFMVRNPGEIYACRYSGPSDAEFVAALIDLGYV